MKIFLHAILLSCVLSIGQTSVAQNTSTRTIKASATKKKFTQLHVGYQLWQETIDATSGATTSEMLTYMHGLRLGYSWHHPFKNVRWVSVYGAELGMGFAKGTAVSPLADEVKDQTWFSATFNPGIMYRSTSKSELGLMLPITYRLIQWKLQEPFDLDRSSSFSVGLTGAYINRFSLQNSFMVSVTHQQMWNATIWGIGYQYDFR
jgi:hypothetical protein